MFALNTGRNRAFSLIELVIVVVIIGIIAAIAIPRMSRGATGAADGALTADLATIRNAIDLYQAEHAGTFPDLVATPTQLTGYTNDAGTVGIKGDGVSIYGPYMRSIPGLPVGADKGQTKFIAAYAVGNGWVYDKTTGNVSSNTSATEKDARNVLYSTY